MADNNPKCTCPYNRAGDDPRCPTHGFPIIVRSHAYVPGAGTVDRGCWHQDEPDDRRRGIRCGIYRPYHLT